MEDNYCLGSSGTEASLKRTEATVPEGTPGLIKGLWKS